MEEESGDGVASLIGISLCSGSDIVTAGGLGVAASFNRPGVGLGVRSSFVVSEMSIFISAAIACRSSNNSIIEHDLTFDNRADCGWDSSLPDPVLSVSGGGGCSSIGSS